MQRAMTIFKKAYGDGHPYFATALGNLALLLKDSHRLAEAEPLIRSHDPLDHPSSLLTNLL